MGFVSERSSVFTVFEECLCNESEPLISGTMRDEKSITFSCHFSELPTLSALRLLPLLTAYYPKARTEGENTAHPMFLIFLPSNPIQTASRLPPAPSTGETPAHYPIPGHSPISPATWLQILRAGDFPAFEHRHSILPNPLVSLHAQPLEHTGLLAPRWTHLNLQAVTGLCNLCALNDDEMQNFSSGSHWPLLSTRSPYSYTKQRERYGCTAEVLPVRGGRPLPLPFSSTQAIPVSVFLENLELTSLTLGLA
ncbi:hypothetical protein ACRALDRAFT_207715 [Sodiomyces alcalophilus JCM 7366]|uniref:uncharacterized protein n=1 Tax=Sodiomyces alcalophilus JCM 7366 TaxID=591952 RepID=UPI0039B49263